MAEQPPNVEPPAEFDFVIERGFDASRGFYDEHVVEQSLYFGIDCTADTVNKIYYFPVDYPNIWTNPDQYWVVSDALYYVDKEVSVEVLDVRVENQLKTTQNSTVPLEMSNVGIRFFDVADDQLISDCMYPLFDSEDYKKILDMKLKSADETPTPLPEVRLLENSLFFDDSAGKANPTRFANVISTKDPRFIEKNNVAENVIYSAKWVNDIGLRKPVKLLLHDCYQTRKFKLNVVGLGAPNGAFIDSGASADQLKKAGFIDENWTLVNTYPCDYRFGHIEMPHYGLKNLVARSIISASDDSRKKIRYTVQLGRCLWQNREAEFPTGNNDVVYQPCTPYNGDTKEPFNIEQNFDMYLIPYEEFDHTSVLFKNRANYDIATGDKLVETMNNTYWNNLPNTMPFSGNKTCKHLYMCVDPAYIGPNIMPSYVRGRLRLKHKIQVFKRDWTYDKMRIYPESTTFKRATIKQSHYGLDATYTITSMPSPFLEGNAKITFLNSYQEIFYPAFVTMFVNLDKSDEDIEPVVKKTKV